MNLIRNIRKGLMFLRDQPGLSSQDKALLHRYLDDPQQQLFLQMDVPDQVHSLNVARLCADSLQQFPQVDQATIMKAALLHDVGKIGAQLGLFFRTFWVLSAKVLPWIMIPIARRGESAPQGSLRYKMWLQLMHGDVGTRMLREIGTPERVCELVAATGFPKRYGTTLEERILLAADADRVHTPEKEKNLT